MNPIFIGIVLYLSIREIPVFVPRLNSEPFLPLLLVFIAILQIDRHPAITWNIPEFDLLIGLTLTAMIIEIFRKKRSIPYRMFDRAHYGLEAKNARILERIYHKGQALAWDGKEVLESLIAEHGTPEIDDEKKEALSRIFGIIMWGELAAWRISAELADELEPLEAKMAATSQAYSVDVDRLGVCVPNPVSGEDASEQFYL